MIIPKHKIIDGKAKCEKCHQWFRVHGIYRFHGDYICKVCSPHKIPMTFKKALKKVPVEIEVYRRKSKIVKNVKGVLLS